MHKLLLKNWTWLAPFVVGAAILVGLDAHDSSSRAADDAKPRVFEMRTYYAHDGKFEALHKRFREHTCQLFEKHGMTNIGYWIPTEEGKDNTLVYILAYPSREAREASWKAFLADPDWQAVYKESHQDGPLVAKVDSKFLTATDYSKIK